MCRFQFQRLNWAGQAVSRHEQAELNRFLRLPHNHRKALHINGGSLIEMIARSRQYHRHEKTSFFDCVVFAFVQEYQCRRCGIVWITFGAGSLHSFVQSSNQLTCCYLRIGVFLNIASRNSPFILNMSRMRDTSPPINDLYFIDKGRACLSSLEVVYGRRC